MKYVVQTSFLSRKWRYMWTSVSTLVFDSEVFYKDQDEDENVSGNPFERFVDKVLMLRGTSDIKKFHLCNDYDSLRLGTHVIQSWILAVVRRNVKELHIRVEDDGGLIRLPHCLFNSELLTGLVLQFDDTLDFPDIMSLPRLKSLHLNSFGIRDLKFVNKLLLSCAALETLVIQQIRVTAAGDKLSVYNRELKHLEISYINYQAYEREPRIIICTPNLTSFICEDFNIRDYCLENLSSLVTANIRIKNLKGAGTEEQFRKRMLAFLMAFHNVKELTLSPDSLQVFSGAPNLVGCQLPQFRNLQCLKLEMCFNGCCLYGLSCLLTITPCVESLFITSNEHESENDAEAVLSGSCILSHLKYIEVRQLKGCYNELLFLEFVLKNAIVLEEMVLYFCSGRSLTLNERKRFGEKIKALPRVSSCFIMLFC